MTDRLILPSKLIRKVGSPPDVRIRSSRAFYPPTTHAKRPSCESKNVVKNGFIHNGNQNHKCKACGRQFVEAPKQKLISQETKALIDKLLLEKIPLAGIARVCEVSETWLQDYVNRKYQSIPRQVDVSSKKKGD
jgi:transposase-like protein